LKTEPRINLEHEDAKTACGTQWAMKEKRGKARAKHGKNEGQRIDPMKGRAALTLARSWLISNEKQPKRNNHWVDIRVH